MRAFTIICLLLIFQLINVCSGGDHDDGSSSTSPEGEGVKILKPPRKLEMYCDITIPNTNLDDSEDAPPPVKWYNGSTLLEADERVQMKNKTLTINPTQAEDLGDYFCQSTFDSSQKKTFDVVILSYRSLAKSTTATEGHNMTLICEVEGKPIPNITWYKERVRVEDALNATKYEIQTTLTTNDTLVIKDLEQSDRSHYTCNFTNHRSLSYNTTTNLRVKDVYAALWPFLGIIIEVVLLCLVIFIYERHHTKTEYEESDTDTNQRSRN